MRETKGTDPDPKGTPHLAQTARPGTGRSVASEIQRIAWEKCGIVRSAEGLRQAEAQLEALTPQSPEERNARQVALLIARCALARQESRGAHFRTDFPKKRAARGQHSSARGNDEIGFRPNR